VCALDAGPSTLEALGRSLHAGSTLLALGPQPMVEALTAYGLSPDVRLVRIGSVAGGFRPSAHLVRAAAANAAEVACHGAQAFSVIAACGLHARRAEPLAVDPSRVGGWSDERRGRVRAALGLRAGVHGILLAGDPSACIDARFAVRAAAMARLTGARIRLVASPAVMGLDKARAWLGKLGASDILAVSELADEPWRVLGALDAAFVDRESSLAPLARGVSFVDRAMLPWGPLSADWRGAPPEWGPSPLVARWALAAGLPTLVHLAHDLRDAVESPHLRRFGDDIADCAEQLAKVAGGEILQS
ncbi:MAG: hypothetical protein ACO3IB_01435, partial [Phycisphaerales bacterium]